ncbi:hypothetical protein Q8V56_003395 [Vibrio cholerae]|nr:hypothetical protein [Vibrio cholerae]
MVRKAKIEPSIHIHHDIFLGRGGKSNDFIIMLLKGHLVIEAVLAKILNHCGHGEEIWRWSFPQKVDKCYELGVIDNVGVVVSKDINDIRNDFCHSLGHDISFDTMYDFLIKWNSVGLDYGDDLDFTYEVQKEEFGIEGILDESMSYLIESLYADAVHFGVNIEVY